MDQATLVLLANRARDKFRGRYPSGVTPADCFNECVVRLLELDREADSRVPEGVNREAWLVTRCHGDIRDLYGRLWKRQNQIRVVSAADTAQDPPEEPDLAADIQIALKVLKGIELRTMKLFLAGLTQDQIAETIGHTQPSVSHIMARAKKKMAPLLEAYRV